MAAGGKGKARGKQKKAAQAAPKSKKYSQGLASNPSKNGHGLLTMQQEALNTDRESLWRSNTRLRDSKITFVRGSDVVPEPDAEADESDGDRETAAAASPEDAPGAHMEVVVDDAITAADGAPATEDELSEPLDTATQVTPPDTLFYVDTSGAKHSSEKLFYIDTSGVTSAPETGLENPSVRTPSPTPSDSGSDVVVFAGRNKSSADVKTMYPQRPKCIDDPPVLSTQVKTVETRELTLEVRPTVQHTQEKPMDQLPIPGDEFQSAEVFSGQSAAAHQRKPRQSRSERRRQKQLEEEAEEAAILADYIENMMQDDNSEEDAGPGEVQLTDGAFSWSSGDLEDLDALSTSDELPAQVDRVFSTRQRQSGRQFLIVGKGQTPDYARWIPHDLLTMPGATEHIRRFEERQIARELDAATGVTSDSDEEGPLENNETGDDSSRDSELDELEFLQRRKDRMTDEQIARALHKQQLFGMDTDELLLFDDFASEDDLDDLDDAWTKPSRSKRGGAKSKARGKDQFPNASAFADTLEQYPEDAFDIMDWERPSLKSKTGGRRNARNFELSDSELEAELQKSWATDRQKKKARKQEREELRALGLLGRKSDKADLRAKYSEGMTFDDLKDEIRAFLLSSSDSFALPPMDSKTRKTVHELAALVSLKSKSRGSGSSRFTVLIKTNRTATYNERTISSIDRVMNTRSKRFLPRATRTGPRGAAPGSKKRTGGGGVTSGASYMDGEIVGASAPEIGIGNKGRSMLEKMGWSQGTALGALHNKGILTPVEHRVKSTKAGLG